MMFGRNNITKHSDEWWLDNDKVMLGVKFIIIYLMLNV